jgi:beta-glucosidase
MKRKLLLLLFICIAGAYSKTEASNDIVAAKMPKKEITIEKRIDKLLKKMTLEEKIGQMTQINLDVLGKGKDLSFCDLPFEFKEGKLDTIIDTYKVGSILNTAAITAMSVSEWERIITKLQKRAIAATGIPLIYGIDAIHGTTYTSGATLFPQGIAMGATFNRKLVYENAKICAYETKASNIPWNFSPVVDLGRDPRWARQWETFGEDTYLVAEMGKQMIRGYQGDELPIKNTNVAACLKHYLGYSVPFSGKDRTPAIISEQELKEKHFEPFRESINEGALSVMVNSALINGVPVHSNKQLITQWLKTDLNWDGVVVSDWADINNLWLRDKVAADQKEAIKIAINAGIDMSMVPYDCTFCDLLKQLVLEGSVSMKRIDDAVARILRLKYRLNLFEKPYWPKEEYPDFGCEKFNKQSYDAACEAITLLKNTNDILPLKKNARILVTGPNANSMRVLNGGWSYSWQGNKVDEFLPNGFTILKSMKDRFGANNIIFSPGITYKMNGKYWEENEPAIQQAVDSAKNVDYIVLCLGENSYCETPGNLDDLDLSENQQKLTQALLKTGKPIILVLNEGRPRIISKIEPNISAVIQAYLPGSQGGLAIADVLCGAINPSGKLPYTYPKYPNALTTYDHKPSENVEKMSGVYDYDAVLSVQWAFGYGLSYTNFKYTNLTIDKEKFYSNDTLTIYVDVKNTGVRNGKEAVLLFINDDVATMTPDVRRLRGFDKIALNVGETKKIKFKIPAKYLTFVGSDNKYTIEKGSFTIQVGTLTKKIQCENSSEWVKK